MIAKLFIAFAVAIISGMGVAHLADAVFIGIFAGGFFGSVTFYIEDLMER